VESIKTYLDDIESRLIPEQEETILGQWRVFARGEWQESFFSPVREKVAPSKLEWPDININDAIENDELMLVDQFKQVSNTLAAGYGRLLTVRSNFGVGILPSLFGSEKFIMPYEHNTLPNVRPMAGGLRDIDRIIAEDVPDLATGFGHDVFRLGELYEDIYAKYPKIAAYVRTDHPDSQGPMDVCELLWGSGIFTALYDTPDRVHGLLRKVTDTYKTFLGKWFAQNPNKDELHAYFGSAHLGAICVRDDSAMNIGPDMCKEFIFPYDQEVLSHFGGGAIHFCGKGDHYVQFFSEMEGLKAINMSQPEYNDMESIYSSTVDKDIPIIGLGRHTVDDAIGEARPLRGLVHTA
jgi:hypothetical protein